MKKKRISCLATLASLMLAVCAFGDTTPIVVLKTGFFVNAGNVSSNVHTIADFEVPAGTASLDKKLVVTFASETQQPDSVSWGGVALSNAAATVTAGNSRRTSVWYADAVPPGTNDVVVTMPASLQIGAINAVAMEGAKPGVALTSVLNDTTGTLITNDVVIASTNTLLVGMYQNNRRGVFLNYWADGGGTAISGNNSAGGISHRGGYRNVALPGVETLAWSNGVSEVSAYAVAGFEEADLVLPEAPPTLNVSVLNKDRFDNSGGISDTVFTLPDFGIPAGSDILDKKLVVVFANKNQAGLDAQSITYGGVELTNAVSNTGVRKCSVWYLDGVTPGTTNDVVVTMPSASNIGTFNVFCLEGAKPGVAVTATLDTVVAKTNELTTIAVENTLMVGIFQNDNGGTLYDYFNAEGFRYFGNINGLLYRSGYASVTNTGVVTMQFINGKDLSSGAAIAGFEGIDASDIDTTAIIETPQLGTPPTIDGTVNAAEWVSAASIEMKWPELGSLPNIGALQYAAPTHEDLSATVYYGWDATYLYFAIDVTDEFHYAPSGVGYPEDHILWGLDQSATNTVWDNTYSVELGVSGSDVAYQDVIKSGLGTITTLNSTFAGTTNAGGWSYEVAMKWTDLMNDGGFVPAISNSFGTHVLLVDNDGVVDNGSGGRETHLTSAGEGIGAGTPSTPSLWNQILLVEELPAPPLPLNYAQWIAQYSLGGETALTNDYDMDGMNHLLEYALGGNPETNDAATVMPVGLVDDSSGSNVFAYVYNRWADAASRGLTYTVERDTDLVFTPEGWTNGGIGEVTGPTGTNGLETVTNTVPADVGQRFLRLLIELAE